MLWTAMSSKVLDHLKPKALKGNLAGGFRLSPGGDLSIDLGAAWRSVGAWREDFVKTGGGGWAIVEPRHKDSKVGRFTARF